MFVCVCAADTRCGGRRTNPNDFSAERTAADVRAWILCQRPREIFLCVLITPGPLPRSYRNSTRLKETEWIWNCKLLGPPFLVL